MPLIKQFFAISFKQCFWTEQFAWQKLNENVRPVLMTYFFHYLYLYFFIFYFFQALPWNSSPKLSTGTESNSEGYFKYLYKDLKHERTKYFNKILPDIYKLAQPYLLDNVPKYLYKERERRF